MKEKDDTTQFPREPWQRLLAGADDGPPETTDARIRAAARRDLAPRGRRWWLPASLAASLVLAVFIVHSQLGTLGVPVVSDSDHGDGGAIHARIIDREEAEAARPAGQAPAAAGKRAAPARETAESDEYGYPDATLAADSAGTGPMVGGPERELKAASEMPEESASAGIAPFVTDLPSPAAAPPAPAADADAGNAVVTGRAPSERMSEALTEPGAESQFATTKIRPPPFEKTPESWYDYIEKLRREGKLQEAERQLERLEKAHPGWVRRHLQEQAER